MNKIIIIGFVWGVFLLTNSSWAQGPESYQNPYAYKNYSCQTPQGRRSGYGRSSEDKRWVLFQIDPQAGVKRYPVEKCRRINLMKIQQKK